MTEGDAEENNRVLEELIQNVAATRLALGRKNRTVANLQRQLDQVPSRAELGQYQRRFMELYSQGSNYRSLIKLKHSLIRLLQNIVDS